MSVRPPQFAERSIHGLAAVTLSATFLLILMGALVTDNEAGDSIPDWPLAYGSILPLGHLQGGAVYEFSHRAVAGTVTALTVALVVLVFLRERRRSARVLALAAVAGLVVQAALGGIRVRLGESHSYGLAALHAFTAQLFLGLLAALTALLSPRPGGSSPGRGSARALASLGTLAGAAAGGILAQDLLGAGYRHRVVAVIPHAAGALLIAAIVVLAVVRARRGLRAPVEDAEGWVLRPALLAPWMLAFQLLLGVAAYMLLERVAPESRPAPAVVAVAVAHLGLGAALLVDVVVLCLRALRLSWAR